MMILATIVCYFAILLLIARITGRKGGSNAAFFKGENQSPWYVVAFGMIGASISGVTFVSVPGMVKAMDMTYMQTVFGFFFGYLAVAHILLPLYYKLNLTSIYTYLDTRIGKRAYRTGASFFLLSRMLGTAAKLYLVCLILYTYVFRDMGIPFWSIAAGSVALVWIYTHKSGIKTIVWTDTLQTFCLIAALISILVFVTAKLNLDFSGVIQTISSNEHSRIFVFDDWMSRQNFFKEFLSGILFTIGIIAAAFSNSDSALTAMTTSFCIDLLDTGKDTEEEARRKRNRVHIGLSVLLIFFICLVDALNNQSVIDAIYIIASYTYGPLLGMFAFGLFTQRKTNDRWVPFIAIASPLICYAADRFARQETGYQFGYELLMLNGILTFEGIWIVSKKQLKIDF